MTVAVPGDPYDYSAYAGIGTEDISAADFGIARWKIDHNEGLFVNNQNDFAYTALDVVLLNIVKQRVMFDPKANEDNKDPWCKSNNHIDGWPGEEFPWMGVPESGVPAYAFGYQDVVPLACASCNLKDWGPKDPKTGKSTTPVCKELYTFTFIVLNPELQDTPGLISIKGTSLAPIKKYLAPFAQRSQPLFIKSTRLGLDAQMYMGRKYYVLNLNILGEVDPSKFKEYSELAIGARDFLTQPPQYALPPDELAGVPELPALEAPAPVVQPQVTQPAPATAPVHNPAAPARMRPAAPETVQTAPVQQVASEPAPPAPPPAISRPAAPAAAVTRPAPAVNAPAPAIVRPSAGPTVSNMIPTEQVAGVDPGSVVVEGEVDELPF